MPRVERALVSVRARIIVFAVGTARLRSDQRVADLLAASCNVGHVIGVLAGVGLCVATIVMRGRTWLLPRVFITS